MGCESTLNNCDLGERQCLDMIEAKVIDQEVSN
jgi:hypothetical protein